MIEIEINREKFIFANALTLQQQFAHVIESVERIRDQQVALGRQIEELCEELMQRRLPERWRKIDQSIYLSISRLLYNRSIHTIPHVM